MYARESKRWSIVALTTLVLVAVAAGAATGTVAAQSAPDCSAVTYNGDGTEANPYEVGNVDQLQCIEDQGLDANYVQVSDIDASETSSWNGGDGFAPIGGPEEILETPFNGTYDGQRHSITDLTIDRTEPWVGLFGVVDTGGEVTNASVVDADIVGSTPTGGLVAANDGNVSESFVTGSVGDSGSDTEGASVGGLVGGNGEDGTITESYSTASVDGAVGVGGLAGGNDGTVEKSYARGSVQGLNTVGGLIGGNGGTVSESYATGSVSVDDIGGILSSSNEESYTESATGSLQDIQPAGGLVAINDDTVTDSYWDTQTTGQSSSEGGTGLTTSQMTGTTATTNMAGFDFTETWETVTGPDDYPVLAWQLEDDEGDSGDGGSGASIDEIQTSLSDTDGDDVPDQVQADVTVSDVGTGQTTVELGETNFDVDVSPTDTGDGGQEQFVQERDPDGDGTPEAVEFTALGTVSASYTVLADLSNQEIGETGTVNVGLGDGTTSSTTYTVEESTGPLDPNNPFGDSGNNPADRGTVINRIVEWNLNGEIDGTPYTRQEIIGFIVQWNLAQ